VYASINYHITYNIYCIKTFSFNYMLCLVLFELYINEY